MADSTHRGNVGLMDAQHSGTARDVVWEKMLTARMNVICYERRYRLLSGLDFGLRLTSTILAMAGVAGAVQWTNLRWLAILAGLVAAAASAATIVLRLNEKIQAAASVLPGFVHAHSALERIYQRSDDSLTFEDASLALDRFDAAEALEAEKAPGASERARDKAQRAVLREIGRPDLATAA